MGAHVFLTNDQIMAESAEYWTAKAREYEAKQLESFDMCDTDGFLSQHALSEMSRMYSLAAHVAKNGGRWSFDQLYDLDGNAIDAKWCETRYGWAYRIETEFGVKWFNPSSAMNEFVRVRNNAKKGYFIGEAEKPARIFWNGHVGYDPYSNIETVYTITCAE